MEGTQQIATSMTSLIQLVAKHGVTAAEIRPALGKQAVGRHRAVQGPGEIQSVAIIIGDNRVYGE